MIRCFLNNNRGLLFFVNMFFSEFQKWCFLFGCFLLNFRNVVFFSSCFLGCFYVRYFMLLFETVAKYWYFYHWRLAQDWVFFCVFFACFFWWVFLFLFWSSFLVFFTSFLGVLSQKFKEHQLDYHWRTSRTSHGVECVQWTLWVVSTMARAFIGYANIRK